jgi:hypothetical protein
VARHLRPPATVNPARGLTERRLFLHVGQR